MDVSTERPSAGGDSPVLRVRAVSTTPTLGGRTSPAVSRVIPDRINKR
jgi:hypothetical protein